MEAVVTSFMGFSLWGVRAGVASVFRCFNIKYLDSRLVTGVRKEKVISSRAEYYCYLLRTLLGTPLFLVEQRYSVTVMSNCISGILHHIYNHPPNSINSPQTIQSQANNSQ